MITIEYGGIDCGYIELQIKNDTEIFQFIFDDLTSDPIPDIVRLLNFVRDGKNLQTSIVLEFGENDLEFKINPEKRELEFQISAWHINFEKICLRFKIYYKKIYGREIIFRDVYLRDELEEMLKKILADLLNDEKFPYFYPVSDCYEENSFDEVAELAEKIAKNIPNLSDEERLAKDEEFFLQMMKDGKVKLADSYKKFLEKYKKMLTDYVIPKNWFKE